MPSSLLLARPRSEHQPPLMNPHFSAYLRFVSWLVATMALGYALQGVTLSLSLGLAFACLQWALRVRAQNQVASWVERGEFNPDDASLAHAGELGSRIYRRIKRLREKHERESTRLRHLISGLQELPNGVILLSSGGTIDWMNHTAAQLLQLDPARDQGQRIRNMLRTPEFIAYFDARQFQTPLTLHGVSAARQRTISIDLVPYGKKRMLMMLRDITEIERTESVRRDFVANVSHEIRTPLTVLSGYLESLESLPLQDAERHEAIAAMRDQANHMQRLVDDLLTLARMEADLRAPPAQALDMPQLIEAQLRDARQLAQKLGRQHSFTTSAEPHKLMGSQSEITSALSNLISNAVRYTPSGGHIEVTWRALEDGRLELGVGDNGCGIAPEHIPRITERFYRVDSGRSRDSGGTGLGLAIVKHVALRHGAELKIESQLEHGSTFRLLFPASRREVQPLAPASE